GPPARRPACGQQGARPAARRGVGEASGSAGDSRGRGGAGGGATGKGALYFPRNKNAALPSGGQKGRSATSALTKMGPRWRLRSRAFAPQASVMASGVRDDVSQIIPVSSGGVKTN